MVVPQALDLEPLPCLVRAHREDARVSSPRLRDRVRERLT
jgi:hypothetical protein